MSMADNKEQGIKLFGTTIPFHGRHLIEEEEERRRRQQRKLQHQEEEDNEDGDNKSADNRRPDKIIPCPRCKSMDTKFCYFNNYNVNQPRHFCKGCQRYWTAGGALRNVPVGAGRRKSKPLGSGRGLSSGFSEGSLYEGSVHQIDQLMDGMMVEEWMHVATDGYLRHGIPVKRPRRSGSVGQPC